MSFKIEIKGLNKLKTAVRQSPEMVKREMAGAIKISVNLIRPIMREEAPSKSGKLSRNIQAISSGLSGSIGPNLRITPYALYIHEGTKPYVIRPKTKKALYWKGALHPVKKVNHPGIKANPFVERTAERMRVPIQKVFKNTINRIINNIHK